MISSRVESPDAKKHGNDKERAMAKGQKKSNKEARKPKKDPPKKKIAAAPSTKGVVKS